MKQVTICTDGGCSRNPGGDGAWAAVLACGKARKEIAGYIPAPTTNNRAELAAVVEALRVLKEPCDVTILSDSSTFTTWFNGRRRQRGMRRGLKNKDLLEMVNGAAARHQTKAEWIKGHAGIPENERCDALATETMRSRANPTPAYSTDKFEVYEKPRAEWPAVAAQPAERVMAGVG